MKTLEPTGERYLPWVDDPATSYEHWHRYAYVSQFVRDRRVLDLACGEGYGSALLAQTAELVVSIDIDEKTVQHARIKYAGSNMHFIIGSVTEIPVSGIGFDVIVCFETIEHIHERDKLLCETKRLLAPEGLFIISTPNRPEYRKVEPSNPFHVDEFDLEEFKGLLSKYFKNLSLLGQRIYAASSLWPLAHRGSGSISESLLDRSSGEFFCTNTDDRNPLYFVALASDAEYAPPVTGAVLIDSSNSLLKEKDRIQNEQEATMQSQQEALAWRETQVDQLQAAVSSRDAALVWCESQIRDLEEIRIQQKKENEELAENLRILQSGRLWTMMQSFFRMRDRLLPIDSRRRTIYERIANKIKPRQGSAS